MKKPMKWLCDRKIGKTQAPPSLDLLARQGRLTSVAVAAHIRDGLLKPETISQLKKAKTYPREVLRGEGRAKAKIVTLPSGIRVKLNRF